MNTPLISRLPALLMSVVMTFGILSGIDSLSGSLRAEAATEMAQQPAAASTEAA